MANDIIEEQAFKTNKEMLQFLVRQVDHLNTQIMGNGRAGMLERITTVESNLVRASELITENNQSLVDCADNAKEISACVKAHIQDDDKHLPLGLLKKRLLVWVIAGLTIISAAVGTGGFLWQIISKAIGL